MSTTPDSSSDTRGMASGKDVNVKPHLMALRMQIADTPPPVKPTHAQAAGRSG